MNSKSNSLVGVGLFVVLLAVILIPVGLVASFLKVLPVMYFIAGVALIGLGGIKYQHSGIEGEK